MFDENVNLNEDKIAEEITEEESVINKEEEIEGNPSLNEEKQEQQAVPQPNFYNFYNFAVTKEQLEKQEIKKLGRAIGFSFLVFYALMWVLNIIGILIARIFEPDYIKAINLLSEPAIAQVQQIIFSISVFTLPFIFVFKLFNYRISDLISFKAPRGKKSLYLFLFGISFCSFANIVASIAGQIFDNAGINYDVDFGDNPEGIFGIILSFLATAIVPALAEEFACRGIMMGALRKKGEAFAVIVSSVLFGLMHSNFEQIPFAFLVGLVLAYVTIKSDTIWIAVAVHFFNNGVSLIYSYFLNDLSVTIQNISYTIFLIVCLILGIFAVSKLSSEPDMFRFSNDTAVTGLKERFKWFFLSVPVLIYSVICILSSLAYFK